MKKLLLFLALGAFTFKAYSQKEIKFNSIFYQEQTKETDDMTIKITDVVSVADGSKFKFKVTNKTGAYLIIKFSEFKFMINGKEMKAKEKDMVVNPNDWNSKVINLTAPEMNKVKNFSITMDGISKVPTDVKPTDVGDLKLGAQNEVKNGPFVVKVIKYSKDTDKTDVKIECAYNGDKYGLVFANRTTVYMPDANEYANAYTKVKPMLLSRGESDNTFLYWDRMPGGKVTDMQKVPMIIKWHDTFLESTPTKLEAQKVDITWDEGVSMEKGR